MLKNILPGGRPPISFQIPFILLFGCFWPFSIYFHAVSRFTHKRAKMSGYYGNPPPGTGYNGGPPPPPPGQGRPDGTYPVYQIDFTAVASGKRISSTKRRVRW